MENSRDYIAFISYRHCPLDIRIAETLHRMIERYRVPRELRKDGEKSLGTVFRDRDELPLSNNLTQDIYDALDHSQFLIVVCTPDTPKSQWVEREIEYFISKHGRDRVLTVLAAGTPEESIPRRITHDYAEDGSVIAEYEPLCAYLVDPSEKNILKNLKKEFLRLIAAMLNCPYDALRQRQKRYRMQQLTALMGVVTAIALVFTLMLGNRNREISNKNQEISQKNEEISIINQQIAEQLLQAQINETNALVLLSQQQLADGDRMGAIESALNALPHDNDGRPYSPDAEYALSQALNPYGNGKPAFHMTIEQPMDISKMTVSDDGKYLATTDSLGCIRCFDVDTGRMLWQYQLENYSGHSLMLDIAEEQELVVFSDRNCSYLLSLISGNHIHKLPFHEPCNSILAVLSPDEKWLIRTSKASSSTLGIEGEDRMTWFYEVFSTESGEAIQQICPDLEKEWELFVPVFNENSTKMAFVAYNSWHPQLCVMVYDTATWELQYSHFVELTLDDYMSDDYCKLVWLPGDELILYYNEFEYTESPYYQTSIHKFDINGNEVAFRQYRIEESPLYSNIVYSNVDTSDNFIGRNVLFVLEGGSQAFDWETCELLEVHRFYESKAICCFEDYRYNDTYIVSDDGSVRELSKVNSGLIDTDYGSLDTEIKLACASWMPESINVTSFPDDFEVENGMGTVCLVPTDFPNTVTVIRSGYGSGEFFTPDSLKNIGSDKIRSYDILSYHDTGFFLTDLSYWGENEELIHVVSVIDEKTLDVLDQIHMPNPCELLALSPDKTKLIFDNCTYDLTTRTFLEGPQEEELGSIGCEKLVQQSIATREAAVFVDGRIYYSDKTLHWWTEDRQIHCVKLPYNQSDRLCFSFLEYDEVAYVGGNGLIVVQIRRPGTTRVDETDGPDEYFIYSITDECYRRLPNPCSTNKYSYFAIGAFRKNIAFADGDGYLRIYDFERNAIIHHWELPISFGSIEEIHYFSQDRYLAIIGDRGDYTSVTVMDAQDGTVLAELAIDSSYYSFLYEDRFTLQTDPEDQILIIHGLPPIVVDMQTWSIIAQVPGMEYYLPGTNTLIQGVYGGIKKAYPLYTWEELAEMGWELVNTVKENRID